MNLDFGDILGRAWRITWQNKSLWILGILAALIRGSANFNWNSGGGGRGGTGGMGDFQFRQFQNMLEQNQNTILAVIFGVICVLLVLNLIFWVLGLLGRGGLIAGARQAATTGRVTLGEAWGQGRAQLGRLFSLWIITDLPLMLIGLIVGVIGILAAFSLLRAGSDWSSGLPGGVILGLVACVLPLVCVLSLASVIARILNHMGTLAAVLEQLSGMEALRRGWSVLRSTPLPLIVLGVLLTVIGGVFSFVSALPIMVAVVPAVVGVGMGMATQNNTLAGGGVLFAVLCCAAYAPVLMVVQGIFETWATSAWTLAYTQLTGPVVPTPGSFQPG